MAAHARRQAEDLVGDGADLDADAALPHLVHDVGVAREGEAVADALRAEQQRVEQVAVRVGADVERLAAVEEEGDLDVGGLAEGLELQELAGEGFERLAFAFLADEVETWRVVRLVLGFRPQDIKGGLPAMYSENLLSFLNWKHCIRAPSTCFSLNERGVQ